jgi:tetratricopeptide (TPR) repeat protein
MKKFNLLLALSMLCSVAYPQSTVDQWKSLLTTGVEYYNEEKYSEALDAFQQAEAKIPTDTFAIVYGANCAYILEDFSLVRKKLDNAIFLIKVNDPRWYRDLLYVLKEVDKAYPHALELLTLMRQKFAQNDSILTSVNKQEIDIYLKSNQTQVAQTALQSLLTKHPQDPILNYNFGVLLEKIGNTDNALAQYQKTLELDNTFFNAYYNLGVHYYNNAIKDLAKVNNMEVEEYRKSGRNLENSIITNFQKALPYWEFASKLDEMNLEVIQVVNSIKVHLQNLQASQPLIASAEVIDKSEEVRKAEIARKAEEERKEEEERKRKAFEEAKIAEELRKVEEAKKLAELKQAEEDRLDAQKKAQKAKEEADKSAFEQKLAELKLATQKLEEEKLQLENQAKRAQELRQKAEEEALKAKQEALVAEQTRRKAEEEAKLHEEKITKGTKPLLAISNLHFEYADTKDTTLHKGQTGQIKFWIENYGNNDVQNLVLNLNQPIRTPDLEFAEQFAIPQIIKGERKQISIPVKYLENNIALRGTKPIDGTQNKMRIFLKDAQGLTLELLEFTFHLGDFNAKKDENDLAFEEKKPRNFLLVIGVNKYKHWEPLKNAVKDAQDIRDVLWNKYTFASDQTYQLYDEQVTRKGILTALTKLKGEITDIDNLLIYYSGHGAYKDDIKTGYWVPYDGEQGEGAELDYLENHQLLRAISFLQAKHIFLVADACFSGSLFLGTPRGYIEEAESKKSRWGLSSGDLELVSDGMGQNSPFADAFLKFLRDNTKERFTVSQIAQFVKENVADVNGQHPIASPLRDLGHQNGGEYVFYLKK